MKKTLIASLALLFLTVTASAQETKSTQSANNNSAKPKPAMSKKELQRKLTAAEKSLWEAFKNKKADVFNKNLTADAVQLDSTGVTGKADIEKSIADCDVKDYALSDFKLTSIGGSAAILTYKATAHGTCGGQAMPETVFASSVWVNRGGKWMALFHQESVASK